MLKGPLTRTRSSEKKYLHHKKNVKTDCEFCEFSPNNKQVVQELTYFWVVKNIFGYDVWDSCGVTDHLMIVPRRHIYSISSFKKAESLEYLHALSSFEKKGYSIYYRSPDNITKSIPHLHTHFIKLDNKRKKFLFFLRKPHFLVYK